MTRLAAPPMGNSDTAAVAEAAAPSLPPGTRQINGRLIEREFRGGAIHYQTIQRFDPVEVRTLDGATGSIVTTTKPRAPVILWSASIDPAGTMAQLEASLNLTPIDVRPESQIHDELERAKSAGFEILVAECLARLKIEPRPELPGFPLGACLISRGARKLTAAGCDVRGLLKRHAQGDHGTIPTSVGVEVTPDARFCPVAFGLDVQNAASIEAKSGVVQSIYPHPYGEKQRLEELKIVTWIGQRTVIYCPRLDATG